MTDTKPWYKHPWLWLLIMIPLVSIILSFTMLWVAINNKDPEVEGNWHKNRKAIEQDFSRDNYASALTVTARLETTSPNLVIYIQSPYKLDAKALPDTLTVTLSHPTHQAKDMALTLKKSANGSYSTPLSNQVLGRYYVDISTSEWRLNGMVVFPLDVPYVVKPAPLSL